MEGNTSYLVKPMAPVIPTRLSISSASDTQRLVEPHFKNKMTARRFNSAGSRLWNKLVAKLRPTASFHGFKTSLKNVSICIFRVTYVLSLLLSMSRNVVDY